MYSVYMGLMPQYGKIVGLLQAASNLSHRSAIEGNYYRPVLHFRDIHSFLGGGAAKHVQQVVNAICTDGMTRAKQKAVLELW